MELHIDPTGGPRDIDKGSFTSTDSVPGNRVDALAIPTRLGRHLHLMGADAHLRGLALEERDEGSCAA